MRVMVCGGRTYRDIKVVRRELARVDNHAVPGPTLVHGGAHGADALARNVAVGELYWREQVFLPDWERHGRAAGPIRNQRMVDDGADILIAFPGGRGTDDCVRRAIAAGIPVRRVLGSGPTMRMPGS